MKAWLKPFGYFWLAFNLVMIGLPMQPAFASLDTDPIELAAASGSDCPFHKATAPTSQIDPADKQPMSHDCCGPDCRCACASLSILVSPRFQSPLNPLSANQPRSAHSLLAELYGSRLLRPPQA